MNHKEAYFQLKKTKKNYQEFRVDDENILEIGTKLTVDHFEVDQYVDASSISVGKGFAGVMKDTTLVD